MAWWIWLIIILLVLAALGAAKGDRTTYTPRRDDDDRWIEPRGGPKF